MGAYSSYFGGGEEKKECWLFHEHKRAELHISGASPCIDFFFLKCSINLCSLTKAQIIHVITFTEDYDQVFLKRDLLKFHN